MNLEEDTWTVINSYFRDTPNYLVRHHIESYNDFIQNKIPTIMKAVNKNGKNTFFIFDKEDKTISYEIDVYFGGKNYDNYKIAKPTVKSFPDGNVKQLFPNEARLKNLTYGADFFFGVDVDFSIKKGDNYILDHAPIQNAPFLQNIYLGKIPIMVQSDICVLKGATEEMLHQMGEDRYEQGGYFIIDGQEKVIVSQERKAENIIFLNIVNDSDKYTHFAEIKSIGNEAFTYSRTTKLQIERDGPITLRLGQERAFLKEVEGRDVPLFIIFRLLGVETDQDIIHYIIGKNLESDLSIKLLNLLRPCILDPFIIREQIYDRESAEAYLAKLPSRAVAESKDKFSEILKNKVSQLSFLYQTLDENLFPHVGSDFKSKAFFLGYMTKRLLMLKLGLEKETDRDNFMNKRIDLSGFMIGNTFRDAFQQVVRKARVNINTAYTYNSKDYSGENIQYIINETNYTNIFSAETFKKHFIGQLKKGKVNEKVGLVQALERLTHNVAVSQLRRIIENVKKGDRIPIPRRRLQCSQYGCVCPCETPEGPKVGLHKGLSILTHITFGSPPESIIEWLNTQNIEKLIDLLPTEVDELCKIFVNGAWIGCHRDPMNLVKTFRIFRRNGLINVFFSITWNQDKNEIYILTDNGRFVRPLYIVQNNMLILQPRHIQSIKSGQVNFTDLVSGFRKRKEVYNYYDGSVKAPSILGLDSNDPMLLNKLIESQSIIEYIDTQEFDTTRLTIGFEINPMDLNTYTHMELHPSMILSYNTHLLPFIQHNQGPRVLFSSKHIKQGLTTYTMNFNNRIDSSAQILNNPEKPLTLCKLFKPLHVDKFGQGQNITVAVAFYNGYNQEDAIIANKGSLDMGLFNTSYFKMYYDTEKVDQKTGEENYFFNPRYSNEVPEYPEDLVPKQGKDYEQLDKYGFIKKGSYLESEHQLVIGKYMKNKDEKGNEVYKDLSTYVKVDNIGSVVDKVFTCQTNKDGHRMCKIKTVQYRKPAIGDKFASRCGQKGILGMLTDYIDMPFTEDGLVPDFILTPGGLPTRMTIAQLIEILFGNLAVELGLHGTFNAFDIINVEQISDILETKLGLTSMGDRVLYNGVTGEQMDVKIFTGVIYYQRLKYMTDDKINARPSGQREDGIPVPGGLYTVRERQSVEGRANHGGLRFGEMERDALLSHGIMGFMKESYLERCDKFVIWVSRHSGELTVGNQEDKIFFDIDDGPNSYQLYEGVGVKGQNTNINNIVGLNLYGQKTKDFVRLEVPYTFKLFLQEMQGMMLKMRMDTDKLEELISRYDNDDIFEYDVSDLDNLIMMDEENNDMDDNIEQWDNYSMEGGDGHGRSWEEEELEEEQEEEQQQEDSPSEDEEDTESALLGVGDGIDLSGGSKDNQLSRPQLNPNIQQQIQNTQLPNNIIPQTQVGGITVIQNQQPSQSTYSVPTNDDTTSEQLLHQYGGVKPDFDTLDRDHQKEIELIDSKLLGIQVAGAQEEQEKTKSEQINTMLQQNNQNQAMTPLSGGALPNMQQPVQQLNYMTQPVLQQQPIQSGGLDMSFQNNVIPPSQSILNQNIENQSAGQYPNKVSFNNDIKVVEIDTTVKNGFLYGNGPSLDPFRQ